MKRFAAVKMGMEDAMPVVLGIVPIGMAYGLLGQQAGLSLRVVLFLSLFVFAGASQFIAISMFTGGAEPILIVGTTFIVNFRHLLMSAAVAPRLTAWATWERLLMGSLLTDESFAVHSAHFARNDANPTAAITLQVVMYFAWAAAGVAGFHLGPLIARPEAWGLDFALPAMFAGLLLPICTTRPAVIAAVCGGATSTLLHFLGFGGWGAFVGALVGATVGVAAGGVRRHG
jgi:4-azaleucine resistance transporter AzlC